MESDPIVHRKRARLHGGKARCCYRCGLAPWSRPARTDDGCPTTDRRGSQHLNAHLRRGLRQFFRNSCKLRSRDSLFIEIMMTLHNCRKQRCPLNTSRSTPVCSGWPNPSGRTVVYAPDRPRLIRTVKFIFWRSFGRRSQTSHATAKSFQVCVRPPNTKVARRTVESEIAGLGK